MTIWADESKHQEALNGCLVVMNIGEENIATIPDKDRQEIIENIAHAHAGARAVIYLFDSDIGPMGPPNEFDSIADMDGIRMAFNVLGQRILSFSGNEVEIQVEMKRAGEALKKDVQETYLRFIGKVDFCGYCLINGKKTFLKVKF